LKYLSECLEKENLTPLRLFKRADSNFNQVLTVEELKEAVKDLMPDKFAGLNYKKLLRAFDMNQNGYIEQDEFLRLMDMAAGSGSNTK
jgi:Ca2+-binding EF-hand superfamily protein